MESEHLKARVLIVDDDPLLLETMRDILETEAFYVISAQTGEDGLRRIKEDTVDLVVTDIKMPGMDGIQLLHSIKTIDPDMPVIVITGFASVETAVEAIREGAYDYVIKPFEVEKLFTLVRRAVKEKKLAQKNKELMLGLEEASRELDRRLHQLFRLDEVSRTISSAFELDDFLRSLVNATTEAVKARVGSLMLFDDSSQYLTIKVARGLDKDIMDRVRIKKGEGIPGLAVEKKKIISSDEIYKDNIALGRTDRELYQSPHFVSIPISGHNRIWGVLNISAPDENFAFSDVDLRLLTILASQASVALENSQLNGKLQNSYLHTLQVLASAIEAKSKYTRGHSERVSRYASRFARYLKLSEDEIKKLQFACGVHDIGKINIADSILNKPTKLDTHEWQLMREHPNKGVEILIPLGILKEIVPLVKHHHEYFNGKGYPDGLEGEGIPFEARVISLVDAYDAMTSSRPYRERMSEESTLKEIEGHLGEQFDPRVGELFLQTQTEAV